MQQLIWRAGADKPDEKSPFESQPPEESDSRSGRRRLCSHFSIENARIDIPGLHREMQVPIYRCSLAEVMVERMRDTPDGIRLADSLAAAPLEGIPRLIGGPDLEAITTTACTPDRCRRSCHAGFIQILSDLGVDSALPVE